MDATTATPEALERQIAEAAAAHGTPPVIHPEDHLFAFIRRKYPGDGAARYFRGGRNDARAVKAALERVAPRDAPLRVLDFAAGYGRVTRFVPTEAPGWTVAASDIHPQACAFITESFGLETHVSEADPDGVDLGAPYDAIYVMSLFSHLPAGLFRRWLARLATSLIPGGVLLFTANGDFARAKLPAEFTPHYDAAAGFGWRELVVDQPDIPVGSYGSMSVSPRFVAEALEAADLTLASFRAGAWFGHQDEWTVRRI